MSDSFDDRRRALEDSYFDALNKQALARVAARQGLPARKSPVNGKPMNPVTVMGVVIDVCVDSGGVWLDAGELGQLLQTATTNPAAISEFIKIIPQATTDHHAAPTDLPSPINGKPMAPDKMMGITVGKCSESGGIWIDAGELKKIISSSAA